MEGSYSKVWRLCRPTSNSPTLPRPEFAFFVSTLIGTVRTEIASCDERAYTTLPLADAKTLLFFDTDVEVRAFAQQVRPHSLSLDSDTNPLDSQRGWYIDPKSTVHFPSSPSHPGHSTKGKNGVPSTISSGVGEFEKELNKERVVAAALAYAKELETIV